MNINATLSTILAPQIRSLTIFNQRLSHCLSCFPFLALLSLYPCLIFIHLILPTSLSLASLCVSVPALMLLLQIEAFSAYPPIHCHVSETVSNGVEKYY